MYNLFVFVAITVAASNYIEMNYFPTTKELLRNPTNQMKIKQKILSMEFSRGKKKKKILFCIHNALTAYHILTFSSLCFYFLHVSLVLN